MKIKTICVYSIFSLIYSVGCSDSSVESTVDPTIQNLAFNNILSSDADSIRTLNSLKIEGDLFMITYYGNYNSRIEILNDRIVQNGIGSVIPLSKSEHECSIFAALGDSTLPIFGRNYDNNDKRGVLVGFYTPPDGYASIAVTNMYHLGYGPDEDPTQLPLADRQLLLNAVLFAEDGINELGVSIALASVDAATIQRRESKKLVCLSYIMREVLDHAGSLEEGITIIQNHDVFDQNINTISHHFLLADAFGRSAVAEYVSGEWRVVWNDQPWQIATNSRIYNRSETWKRNDCIRYKAADDYMINVNGKADAQEGMDVLNLMSEDRTQWSTVYDLFNREVYLVLHRNYNNIQRVKLDEPF
jgi:hypothetical protein